MYDIQRSVYQKLISYFEQNKQIQQDMLFEVA